MLKIIEWNINQRLNYARKNMPEWIAEVIVKEEADIVVLTEVYRGNNWEEIKKIAFEPCYAVFETSNGTAAQNDVVIAINVRKLEALCAKTHYPDKKGIPDCLEVMCKDRESNKRFSVFGARIHASVSDDVKMKELAYIIAKTGNSDTVIIAGDFNNNRRGFCENGRWNLSKIDEMINPFGFKRKTPEGSSIYRESKGNDIEHEFAEDHFLIRGIEDIDFELLSYDREFVKNDEIIYKWGKDFQFYLGKDCNGRIMSEYVPASYPDHAILKAKVEIR